MKSSVCLLFILLSFTTFRLSSYNNRVLIKLGLEQPPAETLFRHVTQSRLPDEPIECLGTRLGLEFPSYNNYL